MGTLQQRCNRTLVKKIKFGSPIDIKEYRLEGFKGGIMKVYKKEDGFYNFIKNMPVRINISDSALYKACCLR